ncbi:MAG: YceI family protein [Myxococcales bacterium]|nr:YceI family protein [Myxococcales bacterium]
MTRTLRTFLAAAALLAAAPAAATDFGVLANTSNISFTSDALLETITGTTSSLGGTLSVDLANPSSARGTITADVATLRTGVDMRDEHLVSDQWLDAAAFPQITFEITSVEAPATALTHGQAVAATVTGTMTIKGTSQTLTVPATVTYYEVSDAQVGSAYGITNNIVRVTTHFSIELDDFGISIAPPLQAKVSNTLQIDVRVTAQQQ